MGSVIIRSLKGEVIIANLRGVDWMTYGFSDY